MRHTCIQALAAARVAQNNHRAGAQSQRRTITSQRGQLAESRPIVHLAAVTHLPVLHSGVLCLGRRPALVYKSLLLQPANAASLVRPTALARRVALRTSLSLVDSPVPVRLAALALLPTPPRAGPWQCASRVAAQHGLTGSFRPQDEE